MGRYQVTSAAFGPGANRKKKSSEEQGKVSIQIH
jgi:hypothetical protein